MENSHRLLWPHPDHQKWQRFTYSTTRPIKPRGNPSVCETNTECLKYPSTEYRKRYKSTDHPYNLGNKVPILCVEHRGASLDVRKHKAMEYRIVLAMRCTAVGVRPHYFMVSMNTLQRRFLSCEWFSVRLYGISSLSFCLFYLSS